MGDAADQIHTIAGQPSAAGRIRTADADFDVAVLGASGHTGWLCAQALARKGLRVLLVGRSAAKLRPLAAALPGSGWALVAAGDAVGLAQAFGRARIVLACAGPFGVVGMPAVEAALSAGRTYLDISGEIEFYQQILAVHDRALAAGVALVAAAGFDATVGEIAAGLAAQRLSSPAQAVRLTLATTTQPSRGSLVTLWAGLGSGAANCVLRNHQLQSQPIASQRWRALLPAPFGSVRVAGFGLVELLTVGRALQCPTVDTGIAVPQPMLLGLVARFAQWVHSAGRGPRLLRNSIAWLLERASPGGSAARRQAATTVMLAVASDAQGQQATCVATTGDVGEATAACVTACAVLALAKPTDPGVWTPTQAFGVEPLRDALAAAGVLFQLPIPTDEPSGSVIRVLP